jgi:hypothetical protein
MKVKVSGSTITDYGDDVTAPYVEFPINEPNDFESNTAAYTVTGSSPNRKLVKAGATVAVEAPSATSPDSLLASDVMVDDGEFNNIVGADLQTALVSVDEQLGGGGAVAPVLVRLQIQVTGTPSYDPATVVALYADQTNWATIAGGPFKLNAGGTLSAELRASDVLPPVGSTIEVGGGNWQIAVSNAAGTEKLVAENVAFSTFGVDVTVQADPDAIDEQVGTDLSINGVGRIESAAGGQFFATIIANGITYTPAP